MRCYNGAPDDELAAVWKSRDDAHAALKAAGLHATYFPIEGKWHVSTSLFGIYGNKPWREVGGFEPDLITAARKALALEAQRKLEQASKP